MAYRRSKEDEINKISTSIFVTNFPDQFYAKDLWKACNQYGSVVDAFIPNRRSKVGKRFGFVRFVKVFDVDRLVNNLCTIWVDRFKHQANKARFQRHPKNSSNVKYSKKGDEKPASNVGSKDSGIQGYSNSYIHVVIRGTQPLIVEEESKPTLVLDESCLNQNYFSTCLVGKVKEFSSLTDLKVVFANEGFDNIKLKYMGGYWVMIEFQSEDSKEKFKANDETCFHSKRICIKTKLVENIFESFKIISKGIVFWVRAKEVSGWILDFVEDEEEDNDSDDGIRDDGLEVENADKLDYEDAAADSEVEESEIRSQDLFNIYDLLNKKQDNNNGGTNSNNTIKYPHGFTPIGTIDVQSNDFITVEKGGEERTQNIQEGKVDSEKSKSRPNNNSMEDKEESICSGHFKKPELERTGGEWIPNGNKLLIISIYAPQELSEKKMLWDYLTVMIGNWNGDVVIMSGFNEVRTQEERYGSIFNVQGANAFNSFILNAGLEDVHLGECSFTWCHKSANKMSKLDRFFISESLMSSCPNIHATTMDRYLSDHRPILMREAQFDYGPIPFKLYHYWFELEGFDTFMERTWNEAQVIDSNDISKFMKKLKYLKEKIRAWIKSKKDNSSNHKKILKAELAEIDLLIDKG
ncbi:RNA-directed DNA polymerase, eukaryota [Tanacetum coccineum]